MALSLRVALVALLVAGLGVRPATAAPVTVCRPGDARLAELSGLGVGIASPGVLYVHNDSGDTARFFALDAATCTVLAEYAVPGARNVDWEDLAVARDAAGTPSVWLADIGDNRATRPTVTLYRVDEPHVDPAARDARLVTAAPDVWRLRYPDGPHDAESLAVAPGGRAWIVTKVLGRGTVYAVPPAPGAGVQQLVRVGALRFPFTGTRGGPNPLGQLTATGAALSADGTLLAVRTYTDAYLWRVRDGDMAAAIAAGPVRVPLPAQPQGEGIAVALHRLLVDSEGVRQPVEAVPLPPLPEPVTSAPRTSTAVTASSTALEPAAHGGARSPVPWLPAAAAVVVAGAAGLGAARRRRARHG